MTVSDVNSVCLPKKIKYNSNCVTFLSKTRDFRVSKKNIFDSAVSIDEIINGCKGIKPALKIGFCFFGIYIICVCICLIQWFPRGEGSSKVVPRSM